MKSYLFVLASVFLLGFALTATAKTDKAAAASQDPAIDEPAAEPTATPVLPSPTPTLETATPTPTPGKLLKPTVTEKALVIHKPMPNPAWGKVIQYRREQNFALSESNREVSHEFLFQDDEGTVRTAIFHENSTGGGYWEVWVWDQR